MKRMEIFCSSPASTAICSSIDQRSMVRQSHKTSLLEKHHQQQQSPRTSTSKTLHNERVKVNKPRHHQVPCSSHLPINPTPLFENTRKSTSSSSSSSIYKKSSSFDSSRRKSSADIYDLKGRNNKRDDNIYLLSETPSFVVDWFPENSDDRVKLKPANNKVDFRSLSTNSNKDSSPMLRYSNSSSTLTPHHQEVVLRVSLHCKGCEGKVKKHLSKMEGVTSFSIDLAAKKVTVIGDITPLGVLQSVSKVKNAQLWPSHTSSPSSPWSA